MNLIQTKSAVDKYNRELRSHRRKRALAWCGIVVAGSLLVFTLGALAIRLCPSEIVGSVACSAVLAWGLWGVVFIKTRH